MKKPITEQDLIKNEWWWRWEDPRFTFDPERCVTKPKEAVKMKILGREVSFNAGALWKGG